MKKKEHCCEVKVFKTAKGYSLAVTGIGEGSDCCLKLCCPTKK